MKGAKLDLVGGSGEKPRSREATPPRFVYDPSAEEVAAMDDDELLDVHRAMLVYDASGGRVLRKLQREIDRRSKARG